MPADYSPFTELHGGEPILDDGNVAVTTEGVFPTSLSTACNDFSTAFGSGFCGGGPASSADSDGESTGSSTVTASLQVLAPLDGESEGDTSISATLTQVLPDFESDVEGTSTVEADLTSLAPSGLMQAESTGTSTVTGSIAPYVGAVGRTYVYLALLDNGFNELDAEVNGEGDASATLFQSLDVPYQPVNYPIGRGLATVDELLADIFGYSEIGGNATPGMASLDVPEEAAPQGTSTVEGQLDAFGILGETTTIYGDAEAVGELFVDGTAELAADIRGDADAHVYQSGGGTGLDGTFPVNQAWHYYIYGNVNVGFNPTDDVNGSDGDIVRDFNRYLNQYVNVNVAFDYTDDASSNDGFVSQTYPDGDIIRDFARYKYQYLLVIKGQDDPDHRLTIGPAPRGHKDLTPTPRPPRKEGR